MQTINKSSAFIKHTEFENESELSNLAARAAHDIRSPIAVMEIGLQMIEPCISKKDLMMFKMAIQRVRDVTNNLLDSHRSGHISNSVLIKPILEQVISLKRYEWQERDCELIFSHNLSVELARVNVVSSEVNRILSNLLNNAIEACKRNAKIEVCANKVNEFIEIIITDNGMGISSEKIKKYLNGESSKHIGMGYGLSSAKQYMENHGGKLLLKSQLGVGTTIILSVEV
jgi:signal transduction histidine kinase